MTTSKETFQKAFLAFSCSNYLTVQCSSIVLNELKQRRESFEWMASGERVGDKEWEKERKEYVYDIGVCYFSVVAQKRAAGHWIERERERELLLSKFLHEYNVYTHVLFLYHVFVYF